MSFADGILREPDCYTSSLLEGCIIVLPVANTVLCFRSHSALQMVCKIYKTRELKGKADCVEIWEEHGGTYRKAG